LIVNLPAVDRDELEVACARVRDRLWSAITELLDTMKSKGSALRGLAGESVDHALKCSAG
jgi:hypothetical protein